jgi:hypothetical protein
VVAVEQVKGLLERTRKGETDPLFVFDAGYDPVKLQQELEGSACQILVRLRAGRRFYADPSLSGLPAHTGRPRRYGPKMKCNEVRGPEHLAQALRRVRMQGHWLWGSASTHLGESASEGPGARKTGHPRTFAHSGRDAGAGGGRAPTPRRETARAAGLVAMVVWPRGGCAGPRASLARLRQALRS